MRASWFSHLIDANCVLFTETKTHPSEENILPQRSTATFSSDTTRLFPPTLVLKFPFFFAHEKLVWNPTSCQTRIAHIVSFQSLFVSYIATNTHVENVDPCNAVYYLLSKLLLGFCCPFWGQSLTIMQTTTMTQVPRTAHVTRPSRLLHQPY